MTVRFQTDQRLVGKFEPRRCDDLKPELLPFVGRSGEFRALWQIEPGEPYEGEWAMELPREWGVTSAVWAPTCDIVPTSSSFTQQPCPPFLGYGSSNSAGCDGRTVFLMSMPDDERGL